MTSDEGASTSSWRDPGYCGSAVKVKLGCRVPGPGSVVALVDVVVVGAGVWDCGGDC